MGGAFGLALIVALYSLWKLYELRGALADFEVQLEREKARSKALEECAWLAEERARSLECIESGKHTVAAARATTAAMERETARLQTLASIWRVLRVSAARYPRLLERDNAAETVLDVIERKLERDLEAGITNPEPLTVQEAADLAEEFYRARD